MRTPKQIAQAKRFRENFTFGTGTDRWENEIQAEIPKKFDCTNCGDPTHGSYRGAIMSNMCWACTSEHVRGYDEWLCSLNLKKREDC